MWYRDHKRLSWAIAAGVVFVVVVNALGSIGGDDKPVEPINNVQAKPKVIVKTKTITKVKDNYPKSCTNAMRLTRQLATQVKKLTAAPDEAIELISDARIAVAEKDADAQVDIMESLSDISEAQDGSIDAIITLERALVKAETSCENDIK